MLTTKEVQQKLYDDTNKKLAESFYKHSNDHNQNEHNLALFKNSLHKEIVKPPTQVTYKHSVREVVGTRSWLSNLFNKKTLYLYQVFRQDNPNKIIKTFDNIKNAYKLSNSLNETNTLVSLYKTE